MPETRLLELRFSDIPVNPLEIYRLLGYPEGFVPDGISETLNDVIKEAPDHFKIRGGYAAHDIINLDTEKGIIEFKNAVFSPGRTICNNLKNSEKALFFLCTAGDGVKKWTTEAMGNDPVKGYMIDLLGSIVVDSAVDILASELETKEGFTTTNRYSPGYCGWKLAEQEILFSMFPEKFCNIQLTPSFLMLPIKSVSGIIGAGANVRKQAYECEICDANDCMFRNLRNQD